MDLSLIVDIFGVDAEHKNIAWIRMQRLLRKSHQ